MNRVSASAMIWFDCSQCGKTKTKMEHWAACFWIDGLCIDQCDSCVDLNKYFEGSGHSEMKLLPKEWPIWITFNPEERQSMLQLRKNEIETKKAERQREATN